MDGSTFKEECVCVCCLLLCHQGVAAVRVAVSATGHGCFDLGLSSLRGPIFVEGLKQG